MDQPAPYPEAPKGTKYREIPFPVLAPPRVRKPMTARRRDGTECDIAKTLPGLRPAGAVSPDEMVHDWRPV